MDPDYNTTPQSKKTIESLWRLEKVILDSLDYTHVVQTIVDSVLTELDYLKLGYRIVVLALLDEQDQTLKRISISQTAEAQKALEVTPVPFKEIDIPLSATDNYCIKTLTKNSPHVTHDWKDILVPSYTPQDAVQVQEIVGIKTSMIYPVTYHGQARGVMIFSMVKGESEVTDDEKDLIRGFTDIVGLAVQNSKLYTQVQEANVKLQELDKLKDEFISVTSHELRAPMTAIKSYTWLVLNDKAGPIDVKARGHLDKVYQSTERLIHLVSEMLDVSRIESGRVQLKPEIFSVKKLADDVLSDFTARAAEMDLTLENRISDEQLTVSADREKIHQVLENLVSNAIKFTPAKGSIYISAKSTNGFLETTVTDTGAGISPEDQKKLFVKFGRLENSLIARSGTGSGLGLYICKQYVELHKGKIWFTSEVGKGSDFTFSLPIA